MKQTGLKFQADRMVADHRRLEKLRFTPHALRLTPSYRAPWYRAIDWEVVSKHLCLIALAGCLIYLGIFMFAPFATRMMR
jgi:hypothetical protein